jgi:acyl-CoA reductase-like NAD-dependent aldehyde dehydrogenase
MTIQRTISPIDGSVVAERELADETAVARALDRSRAAFPGWRATPVAERCALLEKAVDAFVARRDEFAREITLQMGRPIAQSPGEVRGFEERARYMLAAAPAALGDVEPEPKPGFTRLIRREPLGLVLVVAPWNYPYLTAVNASSPPLPPATRCFSSTPRKPPCAPSASSRRSMRRACLPACSSIST